MIDFTPWIWASFGAIAYNFLSFSISKDESDKDKKRFNFKAYKKARWDNWVWSIICIPMIAVYGEEIFYYVTKYFGKDDWKFYSVIYLCAGVLAESMYFLLKKAMYITKWGK